MKGEIYMKRKLILIFSLIISIFFMNLFSINIIEKSNLIKISILKADWPTKGFYKDPVLGCYWCYWGFEGGCPKDKLPPDADMCAINPPTP